MTNKKGGRRSLVTSISIRLCLCTPFRQIFLFSPFLFSFIYYFFVLGFLYPTPGKMHTRRRMGLGVHASSPTFSANAQNGKHRGGWMNLLESMSPQFLAGPPLRNSAGEGLSQPVARWGTVCKNKKSKKGGWCANKPTTTLQKYLCELSPPRAKMGGRK